MNQILWTAPGGSLRIVAGPKKGDAPLYICEHRSQILPDGTEVWEPWSASTLTQLLINAVVENHK